MSTDTEDEFDQLRSRYDVLQRDLENLAEIEEKIAGLEEMRATLSDLVSACHGDDRPDCPILKRLEAG